MAEGWVPHVVCKTRRTDDGAYGLEVSIRKFRMAFLENPAHIGAQRASHTRNFERVGQTIVHEHATRKGEYLCLILHTTKSRRKNQTVKIALEFRALLLYER